MRLIDAYSAKEALEYTLVGDAASMAERVIDRQPTIDAVPVDRCEKCVLHGNCTTEDAFLLAGIENPFCCVGKRKEDKHEAN